MNNCTLSFLKPGLYTSIQDSGRCGYEALGVPQSGALDRQSAKLANKILGLDDNHPVLEITLLGPEIHFSHEVTIAITGADFDLKLNGKSIKRYESIQIPADSVLKFGYAKRGCRAYMAIAAGWKISDWLGSVSPLGFNSGKLQENIIREKGQEIQLVLRDTSILTREFKKRINLNPVKRVRVTPGPELDALNKIGVTSFFGQPHQITQDANRMGYRLSTVLAKEDNYPEMISSGVLPGTIQLTSSGQPIILLADAQTTGGYPRIARIIDEDLDVIGQLKPGDKIWFSLTDSSF